MKHLILFNSSKASFNLGTKSFDVFVLENNERVLSIKSIQKALGYDGKNENWLFEFLKEISIYLPITAEILDAYQNPLQLYKEENNNQTIFGTTITLFIETLEILVKAKNEGFLNVNQIKFSKEAKLLVNHENIAHLKKAIDDITGFTIFRENSIDKLILNLQKTDMAFKWIKTFPDTFFELLLEMKNLNWKNLYLNQGNFGEIINEIVFSRIDNDLLEELRVLNPKRSYQRKNSKPQDLQHTKLKQHLAILLSLAKVSGNNWNIFIQLINKSFPEQKNRSSKKIKLIDNNKTTTLSAFDENLLKSLVFKTR